MAADLFKRCLIDQSTRNDVYNWLLLDKHTPNSTIDVNKLQFGRYVSSFIRNYIRFVDVTTPSDSLRIQHGISTQRNRETSGVKNLAFIYSTVLSGNVIEDLLAEIIFLLAILSEDVYLDYTLLSENFWGERPLTCEKDCVQFSSLVLRDHWNIIKCFDQSTLSILSKNTKLNAEDPEFAKRITEFSLQQSFGKINRDTNFIHSETVKFNIENDSQDNYTSSDQFISFKRQRDEFYGLLERWRDNDNSNHNFFKFNNSRLRSILNSCVTSSSMLRFVQLFVSQLILSVKSEARPNYSENIRHTVSEDEDPKINLLTKRLLFRDQYIAECNCLSGATFPGIQAFFKEFILSSIGCVLFRCHLKDVLVSRISNANKVKFNSVTGSVEYVDGYVDHISKLCLMAKFLSLIVFSPYRENGNISPSLKEQMIAIRSQLSPELDVGSYFIKALKEGNLALTLPWILEYLQGMDEISPYLPIYEKIFVQLKLLVSKIKLKKETCRTVADSDAFTELLLTFYINNFFTKKIYSSIVDYVENIADREFEELSADIFFIKSEEFVDKNSFYVLCPQLQELKNILQGKKRTSIKHSFPTDFTPSKNINQKFTQMQMEAGFLDAVQAPAKKNIFFVASRVASLITTEYIPQFLTSYDALKEKDVSRLFAPEYANAAMKMSPDERKLKYLKLRIDETLESLSTSNISSALKSLLERSNHCEKMRNLFRAIATRKCREMVYDWVSQRINIKDTTTKIVKKNNQIIEAIQFEAPIAFKESHNNFTCTDGILHLQRIFSSLSQSNKADLADSNISNELNNVVDHILEHVSHCTSCVPISINSFSLITLHITFLIVYREPHGLSLDLLNKLSILWKRGVQKNLIFELVLNNHHLESLSNENPRSTKFQAIMNSVKLYMEFALMNLLMDPPVLGKKIMQLLNSDLHAEFLHVLLSHIEEALDNVISKSGRSDLNKILSLVRMCIQHLNPETTHS